MTLRIQEQPFDPGTELSAFAAAAHGAGAIVTFTGIVRSTDDDPILSLTLECYPDLANTQLAGIALEAHKRFSLVGETIIHRYGTLRPGEPIVQVMTLASHRQAAFEAAEFLMDYLKTDAPFWKKETTLAGSRWVEHRDEDGRARARWS